MGCFVYVLGCAGPDRPLTYVGWTVDLDARLARHNAGAGAKLTRGRKWALLYAERLPSRSAAMSREWHLKRDRAFRTRLRSLCADAARAECTCPPASAIGPEDTRRPGP